MGERDGRLRWGELRRGSFGKLRTGSSRWKDALRMTARTGDGEGGDLRVGWGGWFARGPRGAGLGKGQVSEVRPGAAAPRVQGNYGAWDRDGDSFVDNERSLRDDDYEYLCHKHRSSGQNRNSTSLRF